MSRLQMIRFQIILIFYSKVGPPLTKKTVPTTVKKYDVRNISHSKIIINIGEKIMLNSVQAKPTTVNLFYSSFRMFVLRDHIVMPELKMIGNLSNLIPSFPLRLFTEILYIRYRICWHSVQSRLTHYTSRHQIEYWNLLHASSLSQKLLVRMFCSRTITTPLLLVTSDWRR